MNLKEFIGQFCKKYVPNEDAVLEITQIVSVVCRTLVIDSIGNEDVIERDS